MIRYRANIRAAGEISVEELGCHVDESNPVAVIVE